MKKNIILLIFSLLTCGLYAADVQRVDLRANTAPAQNEVKPMADLQSNPTENIFTGSKTKINFNLKTGFQHDGTGVIFTNELGLKARQTLDKYFLADTYIRFVKPMSNNSAGVNILLEQAKFQYIGTFFQVIFGRVDISKIISTTNYYGCYATAGQRYLDLVGITVPIYLKAGVPEIEDIDIPPMALSVYYMPTLFTYEHTDFTGDQALILGQLRVNANYADTPMQLIASLAKGNTEYFKYSIMSGNLSADVSISLDFLNHAKVNAAFGIMNFEEIEKTGAVSFGAEFHDFKEWLIAIDRIIYEQQIALEPGNTAYTYFIAAENKIGRFRYGGAISNSTNEFTLARLQLVNPNVPPYGQGNVYAPESVIFNNSNKLNPSYYIYIGYEF